MAYTDEELLKMLCNASYEQYCLTNTLTNMGASPARIHNILHTTLINDVEEDVLNRLDRYKRVNAVLSCLNEVDGQITYEGGLYFFSKEEGVAWGTIEELLSDDTVYEGEELVLTVEEIVPKLLKPLLDAHIERQDHEGVCKVANSIAYVFENMIEDER